MQSDGHRHSQRIRSRTTEISYSYCQHHCVASHLLEHFAEFTMINLHLKFIFGLHDIYRPRFAVLNSVTLRFNKDITNDNVG